MSMVPSIYMYFVDTKSCLRMVFNATFNNISFISWQSYVRDKSIKHQVLFSLISIIIITTNV
jgi:hypothetical protein